MTNEEASLDFFVPRYVVTRLTWTNQILVACIALPDATPEELYFRLHEDPAEEIARERSAPLIVGNFRREATVGEVLGTDSAATEGAIRRKR